jgi:hypothetical protein
MQMIGDHKPKGAKLSHSYYHVALLGTFDKVQVVSRRRDPSLKVDIEMNIAQVYMNYEHMNISFKGAWLIESWGD